MKVTLIIGENETKINFVLIKKEHGRFYRLEKAITDELQHALVAANIDMKKIRNVVRRIALREERQFC